MIGHELNKEEILTMQDELLCEEEYIELSLLFKMFSDPTRLRIFSVLSKETVCVDDLSEILGMTKSAISHQLSALRKMNLVESTKVGKNAYYQLKDSHVMQIFSQALDHVRE